MASLLRKLTKKPSPIKLIKTFNQHLQSPNLTTPPIFLHQPHLSELKPDDHPISLNTLLGSPNITSSQPFPIYPSFPFGFFLNPICPSGLDRVEEAEEVIGSGHEQTVWADSVKKKRKKKMNKHKYRKLRKHLGRQS